MRTTHLQQKKAPRRTALLATVMLAFGISACDDVSEPPHEHPEEVREPASAAVLNPEAPRLATVEELATLATARTVDEPPQVPAFAAQSSATAAAASTCTIGFADYIGLLILPDQAGHTFAMAPYYIEGCGSGWVHVKENDVARYGPNFGSNHGHYHLMYEKGPFCTPAGGGYGYKVGNNCVKVASPATEPRVLFSHVGNHWVRIYVYKSGVSEMTFDLKKITVKPNQPIRLWFRKASGAWYVWNNLGVGTWNLAQYSSGIREVLIRASANTALPYSFDNVVVGVN